MCRLIQHFNSPQLINNTNQNEEGVLADSLLEGVWTVAECGICAFGGQEQWKPISSGHKAPIVIQRSNTKWHMIGLKGKTNFFHKSSES